MGDVDMRGVLPGPGSDDLRSHPAYLDEQRRIREAVEARERSFVADFGVAATGNADLAGEAQRLAREIGAPAPAIEANIEQARAAARQRQLVREDLRRTHPWVMRSLQDNQFLRLAHDDLDNLIATDTIWQGIGRKYEAGKALTERGLIGAKMASGLATDDDLRRLGEVDEIIRNAERDGGFLGGSAEIIGQYASTVPIAVGVGAATALPFAALGGPVGGGTAFGYGMSAAFFAQTTAIEGGHTFLELRRMGVAEDTAASVALGAGIVKGALETLGFKLVAAPFRKATAAVAERLAGGLAQQTAGKAFGEAVGHYVKAVGGEVSTEVLQEITDIVAEATVRPADQPEPTWAEIRDRLGDIAAKTAQGMALLGIPGPVVHFASQAQRAQRAVERAEAFQGAAERAAESKVRTRDPEAHATFMQGSAEQAGVQDVYIDAVQFSAALEAAGITREQLGRQHPELLQQLERAESHQQVAMDVVIPAGDYLAKIVKTKLGDALQEHLRFDQDGLSWAEAQEWIQQEQELAQEASSLLPERVAAEREFRESGKRVEDRIYEQVTATGRLRTAREARTAAAVYRAFYETQARDAGLSPEQFYEQFPVAFEAATGEPAATLQHSRGEFDPSRFVVRLFERADLTTTLHEGSHFFLHVYGQMAQQPGATPRMAADMQTLLDWFGVESVEAWNAMSLDEQRKHHERFSYSFEGYLFDGKAPSEELRGLFDRIRRWFREVYRAIRETIGATYRKEFGEELPILTGEVRAVMDRMLAAEHVVRDQVAVRDLVPLFQSREQFPGTDEEWAAYQDMDREWRDAAIGQLERDSLRQMEWLSAARGRLLKEMQGQHDEIRRRVRAEVVAEVAARPAVRADRWLRTGRLVNEDGTTAQGDRDPNHKLDRAAVEAMVPDEAQRARLEPYLRAEGGLSPDAAAEAFGYETGEAMLRDLLAMRPFGEAVDARTDERMWAEHAEFADPAEVEAAVERALHNEARARMVGAELRMLEGAERPVRTMLAAAREAARQAILRMPVAEVTPTAFAQAEARAARMALEATRTGKTDEAIAWKRKQMLQGALAREAGKFAAEKEKWLRNLSRFSKADSKLAKSRDVDLVNAARWILGRYGLANPAQEATAARAIAALQAYDPALLNSMRPLLDDAERNGRDYRALTVEQFQDLSTRIDGLWNIARRTHQIRVGGKLLERAQVRDQLVEQLRKAPPRPTKDQPIRRAFGAISAWFRHAESWALEMDGGTAGPVHRFLFRLLREPYDAYLVEKAAMVNELQGRVKGLQNLTGRKIEARHLVGKDGKRHVFRNRGELIGWLLHQGNADNMRQDGIARGFLAQPGPDAEVDLSPVLLEIQAQVDAGNLTRADFDFVQGVWDTFEHKLKQRAQQAHKDNYGHYFEEIAARPLTVTLGGEAVTYRGGYMPAKADPDLEQTRPGEVSLDGLTEASADVLARHPSAPKGFLIARTGADRALAHDIRLVAMSFAEELQFIHMQRAGRDIASLLSDREVQELIGKDTLENTLLRWLKDTMRDRLMAPGGDRRVNGLLTAARRNVGLGYMFANVVNAVQQLTGVAASAQYVPLKYLRGAVLAARSAEARQVALGKSKTLALRVDKNVGQIVDDIDVLLEPTWLGRAQAWTRKHGYFMQRWFQVPVDFVTWMGAYDHGIAQGMVENDAVAHADTVLRRSQGSAVAADLSALERGSAFVRLLTQFGGFWFAQTNTVLARHGEARIKAFAAAVLFQGIVAGAIAQVLRGGWDDDDEDGELWDDVVTWAFGEAMQTGATVGLPVAGPMLFEAVMAQRAGGRISPAAVFGAGEQAGRALREIASTFDPEQEWTGRDVRDVGMLFQLLGVPVYPLVRPASYALDVEQGNVTPSGAYDYGRGLVTGSAAPGTR